MPDIEALQAKRIVMATEFQFGSTGEGLAHGLRARGWDIVEVDAREYFLQRTSGAAKMASRLTRAWNLRAYNEAIFKAVVQVRAHAFLTVKGSGLARETLAKLSERGVLTANFYPDRDFSHSDYDASTLSRFDLFITSKSYHLEYLREKLGAERVAFVHHGYSDVAHYPRAAAVAEADHAADVTYVGNYSPYKEKWLAAVANRLPDVGLRIVGSRWTVARDPMVKARIAGHVLAGDFYARTLQYSKVNISLHAGPYAQNGWEDLVSTRTFEIPACKGFMLHIDNAEVRELFDVGREIDVFRNEDELVEKIGFYLARPELRRQMIERAYARCVPRYGYISRAAAVSGLITSRLEARAMQAGAAP